MDGYSDLRGFGQNENIGQVGHRLAKKDKTGCLQSTNGSHPHRSRSDRGRLGGRSSSELRLRRIGWGCLVLRPGSSSAIRTIGGVTLERIQRELSGIACLKWKRFPSHARIPVVPALSETAHRVEELEKRWPTMRSGPAARFARKAHLPAGYRFF